MPKIRGRLGRRAWPAILSLLLLAACGTSDNPKPASQAPSSPEVASLDARTETEFSIEGAPDQMGVGFGALWVATEDGFIHRIDPEANEIVAEIDIGEYSCVGVAPGLGSVWAASCIEGLVVRIDPKSNRVVAEIEANLPSGATGNLSVGEGAVWVPTSDADGNATLTRFDPKSEEAEAEIALGEHVAGVAVGLGAVWAADPLGGTVSKIDPQTNEIVDTVEGLSEPQWLAAGEGALWVLNEGDGSVAKIDPEAATVLEKVPVGIPGPAYDITASEGWVWARFSDVMVAKIDPQATEVVEVFRDGQGGGGLRVAYGAIWASAFQQDRVWRISLE